MRLPISTGNFLKKCCPQPVLIPPCGRNCSTAARWIGAEFHPPFSVRFFSPSWTRPRGVTSARITPVKKTFSNWSSRFFWMNFGKSLKKSNKTKTDCWNFTKNWGCWIFSIRPAAAATFWWSPIGNCAFWNWKYCAHQKSTRANSAYIRWLIWTLTSSSASKLRNSPRR